MNSMWPNPHMAGAAMDIGPGPMADYLFGERYPIWCVICGQPVGGCNTLRGRWLHLLWRLRLLPLLRQYPRTSAWICFSIMLESVLFVIERLA